MNKIIFLELDKFWNFSCLIFMSVQIFYTFLIRFVIGKNVFIFFFFVNSRLIQLELKSLAVKNAVARERVEVR